MNHQPVIIGEPPRARPFAASAVAIQAIIINQDEQFLLLSSPRRNRANEWQVVSGGLEAGETVLDGVLREVREEVGDIQVRPFGVIHAQTFHYDAHVRYMIGIYYLLRYEGGRITPGDDMSDAEARWWSLAELEAAKVNFHPSTHLWMLQRAQEMARLWPAPPATVLQPPLNE